LKSDKVLEFQRIGLLPDPLDKLFNGMLDKKQKGTYNRIGVVQNKWAFLNAVLLACRNKISSGDSQITIQNSKEYREYIANVLRSKPDDFIQLNNGNLGLKYSLGRFTQALLDDNSNLRWNELLDIVQRTCRHNIVVLDIPYTTTESTKVPDYDNIKLICNSLVQFDRERSFIVLMKRMQNFEVLVYKVGSDIQYTFDHGNHAIAFLTDYHKNSCVRENEMPKESPYIEMFTPKQLVNLLEGTSAAIRAQIVNVFNKVEFLVTDGGLFIPVQEAGVLENVQMITSSDLRNNTSNSLISLESMQQQIAQVNEILSTKMSILGVTTESAVATAVLTNFGKLVPIIPLNIADLPSGITQLDMKYYPDVDDKVLTGTRAPNREMQFNKTIEKIQQRVYKLKRLLAKRLSEKELQRREISETISSVYLSRQSKITRIMEVFSNVLRDLPPIPPAILQSIANETVNDTVENRLLNNMVVSDVFNPNEIINRDTESILTSLDAIVRWIRIHESQE
jgi:hypothetical protein